MFQIPMINAIKAAAVTDIHAIASTWSPPPWMKTSNEYNGFSRLKPEYFQTFADYHLK
jgi:glucosylceramidase